MQRLVLIVAIAMFSVAPCTHADARLYYNVRYDERADPEADVAAAIALARESHRRVLMEIGGEWCSWCHILDRFVGGNNDVAAAFAASFVIVKVNFSRTNENQAFLSRYPSAEGYPAFVILDSDGVILGAVTDTSVLEQGESYHRGRMIAFAEHWRVPIAAMPDRRSAEQPLPGAPQSP